MGVSYSIYAYFHEAKSVGNNQREMFLKGKKDPPLGENVFTSVTKARKLKDEDIQSYNF
jgi:hypothetical protein